MKRVARTSILDNKVITLVRVRCNKFKIFQKFDKLFIKKKHFSFIPHNVLQQFVR